MDQKTLTSRIRIDGFGDDHQRQPLTLTPSAHADLDNVSLGDVVA